MPSARARACSATSGTLRLVVEGDHRPHGYCEIGGTGGPAGGTGGSAGAGAGPAAGGGVDGSWLGDSGTAISVPAGVTEAWVVDDAPSDDDVAAG